MYAIVEIAGQQFKVSKADKIFVHRLNAEIGSQIEFDKVMLIDNDDKVDVGTPTLSGITVLAEIVEHVKGGKVLVFKKKRRKGYKKLNGHRQHFTRINILSIMKDGKSITGELAKSIANVDKDAIKAAPKEETTPKKAESLNEETVKIEEPEAKTKAEPEKEVKKEEPNPKAEAKTDLSSKTVAELRAMAKEKGISGHSSMKKAELIDALKLK